MRRAMLTAGAFAGGLMAVALSGQAAAAAADKAAVLTTYADIAEAGYADSLTTAKTLQQAVEALIAQPSEAAMKAARQAWIAARVPYMQTEVFRFGNTIVDDWEGKVNAWPLDEGLIDYVDTASYGTESDENPGYAADLIANPKLTIGGETIDATVITPALLQDKLQELAGIEANVATGYHAVEFLLWGQDLNGTGPGAGNRPWSDYATGPPAATATASGGPPTSRPRPGCWSTTWPGWPASGRRAARPARPCWRAIPTPASRPS